MSCFISAEPDPPIRLEKMEETTNKISLALEVQEEGSRPRPGGCFSLVKGAAPGVLGRPDGLLCRVLELLQDCRALPCQNGGSCVTEGDAFVCSCSAGFKGRQCELCESPSSSPTAAGLVLQRLSEDTTSRLFCTKKCDEAE